jgi:hypothetical protein
MGSRRAPFLSRRIDLRIWSPSFASERKHDPHTSRAKERRGLGRRGGGMGRGRRGVEIPALSARVVTKEGKGVVTAKSRRHGDC